MMGYYYVPANSITTVVGSIYDEPRFTQTYDAPQYKEMPGSLPKSETRAERRQRQGQERAERLRRHKGRHADRLW